MEFLLIGLGTVDGLCWTWLEFSSVRCYKDNVYHLESSFISMVWRFQYAVAKDIHRIIVASRNYLREHIPSSRASLGIICTSLKKISAETVWKLCVCYIFMGYMENKCLISPSHLSILRDPIRLYPYLILQSSCNFLNLNGIHSQQESCSTRVWNRFEWQLPDTRACAVQWSGSLDCHTCSLYYLVTRNIVAILTNKCVVD